jgi:nucleoside-diphosphate-sugar epimerase
MERKKIFLLGGTGFIGAALTRQLSADRDLNELMMLLHRRARLQDLEQINTHTGSLQTFELSLLDQFRPDTVIHLARMTGRGRIGRFMAAWRGARANRRIVNHLSRHGLKPHVIYISGSLVYGNCGDVPVNEDHPLHPIAFAREYIKAEEPWMNILREGDIPVTILRPPWIIGKGSWFANFYLRNIINHGEVPLFGDGQNLMSLIDVEDCAGMISHAVRNSVPGRSYNLYVPGACITQLEFVEKLAQCTRAKIRKLDFSEVDRQYGRAVAEAFTFSQVVSTKYPEFLSGYNIKYPTTDAMIGHNLP